MNKESQQASQPKVSGLLKLRKWIEDRKVECLKEYVAAADEVGRDLNSTENMTLGFVLYEIENILKEEQALTQSSIPEANSEGGSAGLRLYLELRIIELNKADRKFCDDRWNDNKTTLEKMLAREESNKVTFARQELQEVLKQLQLPTREQEGSSMRWEEDDEDEGKEAKIKKQLIEYLGNTVDGVATAEKVYEICFGITELKID
jgi:hypothetical protein